MIYHKTEFVHLCDFKKKSQMKNKKLRIQNETSELPNDKIQSLNCLYLMSHLTLLSHLGR